MIDWTKSMSQSFEYYEIDPVSFKDKKLLKTVKNASVTRDLETDTLGSATIDINEMVGEAYIRIYLVAIQNGVTERTPLGVFLMQTPSSSFDGKVSTVSVDAYTPLIELKEKPMPLGYSLLKNDNIMNEAYLLTNNNCRAKVVKTASDITLQSDFTANTDDNYLTYTRDLISLAKYHYDLDANGNILFAPNQTIDELQPIWTYTDDNSSILFPEVTLRHDLYGVPNVVEVVCSTGTDVYTARVENTDPNSPTSIPSRGREIVYRDTNPSLSGIPTKAQIDEYAEALLKELSFVEYKITYSHGYCPVRIGDGVRLNYKSAGLENVRAKVISQNIRCQQGCTVNETAIFRKQLWK